MFTVKDVDILNINHNLILWLFDCKKIIYFSDKQTLHLNN